MLASPFRNLLHLVISYLRINLIYRLFVIPLFAEAQRLKKPGHRSSHLLISLAFHFVVADWERYTVDNNGGLAYLDYRLKRLCPRLMALHGCLCCRMELT